MLRLIRSKSMFVGRISNHLHEPITFRDLQKDNDLKFCYYSTLQKPKFILNPSVKGKENKIMFKAKPYEMLLKVLEAREQNLKKTQVHLTDFKSEKLELSESQVTDSTSNNKKFQEGIYTVKKPSSKKKKNSSKNSSKSDVAATTDKPAKLKKKNKNVLSERQEIMKKTVSHSYAVRSLKSYVDVCINADEVDMAHSYLRKKLVFFKKKYKEKKTADIELFNYLIAGWAKKAKIEKVKEVFLLMDQENIVPNHQSYAGYLECIARCKFLDIAEINLVIHEMKIKNLSHKDILQECIFRGDQREKIIEVLKYVDSEFTQPVYKTENAYSCTLLQALNDKSYERGNMHPTFCPSEVDILKMSSSQMNVEDEFLIRIKSVDCLPKPNSKILKSKKYLEECQNLWRKKLSMAIKNFKSFEKKSHGRGFHKEESVYPYIAVVDTEILVNLLLQEMRLLAETSEFFSPHEKVLYKGLGIKVMNHYFIWLNKKNKITDKVMFIYKKYVAFLRDPKLLIEYTPREYWEYLKKVHGTGPTIDVSNAVWPHSVLVKIGCDLYDILQKNIAFNSNLILHKSPSKVMTQAFYVTYEEDHDVKISKHIRTHHLLCKLYRDAKLDYLEFDATIVPMQSPPKPWVKYNSGGFLITPIPFIRLNDTAIYQHAYYSKVPPKELNPCFDSLNGLSLCPWIINKPVLDIIIDVFQKGGNVELDIPLNPNSLPNPPKIVSTMEKKERALIWRQKKELKKSKCETTSLWFDCLYKLSIANHFRDKIFWFPHNLDFRGRVYPTPPHFNHLGSDMARSILLFAEGQPLGKNGLNWLKIHLINLTGLKKREPHSERLKFANEMMPEILDSADHPFDGKQWWKTSDEPWQTLACCKELAKALRHPNPEEYVSHFPVHQDGSCNGLQHYAALGRDELGAIEVNLHPADAPHDVYSGVSALVERERQKDASNNIEVAQVLEGFVRRKVVKQSVMTFVYNVTKYGAKLQILKQLKDIPEFPDKYHNEASTYLMKKVFFSIEEMFTATQKIQNWFTNCAEQITKMSGDTLEWITPLGLPVIQPYHKEVTIRSPKYAMMQGKESCLVYTSHFEPYQSPNIRKQKNGFPPNFIHSLDATHMMLTSLYCQRKGITFVSVHDCYWTHASVIEVMNKICREQFIALHKEPILEDLSTFFLDKYARVIDEKVQDKSKDKTARLRLRDVLSTIPQKGTFDLDKVLESEYFFS